MKATPEELPWCDCKVAFGCDFNGHQTMDALEDYELPAGWSVSEWDGAGARGVMVFRVEGVLRIEDGQIVLALMAEIEAALAAAEAQAEAATLAEAAA